MENVLTGIATDVVVGSSKKLRKKARFLGLVIILQTALSIMVSLLLYLSYQGYAMKSGIILGSGCHGPSASFAMLSGIMMVLFLRSNLSRN